MAMSEPWSRGRRFLACAAGWAAAMATAATALAAAPPAVAAQSVTPVCGYRVLHTYPHDPAAFTQGLVVVDGELFESTGLWGESSLRRVDLATGAVLQLLELSDELFGEGLAARGDELVQLTYLNHLGLVYDRESFAVLGTFAYPTQGWGITTDGPRLVMSDGSSTLRFWDAQTFAEVGSVAVWDENGPVTQLNELELVDRRVWANVLYDERVARVDPVTGRVTSWVDLAGLLGPGTLPGPLNGIAFDPVARRLLVTGKRWPSLFEVEVSGCVDLLVFSDGFEWGSAAAWGVSPEPVPTATAVD